MLKKAGIVAVMLLAVAAVQAQDEKVLRLPMRAGGPGSLDPVTGSTVYDNRAASTVYETLVQYKFLKRPRALEPLLLEEMPTSSADGLTWSFKLKQGIRFQDDPCFPDGKGREMVAADVFYSWKRLADKRYEFENWWIFKDTVEGFDAYKEAQAARVDAGGEHDYDAPVAGLRLIDDYNFEVVKPPVGATVPYLPDEADEEKIDGKKYFVYDGTYYRPFSSDGDTVYMVVENPKTKEQGKG